MAKSKKVNISKTEDDQRHYAAKTVISDADINEEHKPYLNLSNYPNLREIKISLKQYEVISISGCVNLQDITIENQENLSLTINGNGKDDHEINIRVHNSHISNIDLSGKFKQIELLNNTINDQFHLSNSDIKVLNISNIDESNNNIIKFISIRKSTVECLMIRNQKINSFGAEDSMFKYFGLNHCIVGKFTFVFQKLNNNDPIKNSESEEKLKTEFEIKNSTFKEIFLLNFDKTKSLESELNVSLDNVDFKKYSTISLPNITTKTTLIIETIKCNEGLILNGDPDMCKDDINIRKFYSSSCEGILSLESLNIKNLKFHGTNLKLSTTVNNCSIKELMFENFDNKSILKITNSNAIGKLDIKNSDLNDVVFRPLNAEKIEVKSDSFLGGVKMYGSDAITLEKTELTKDQKQEFYRQLKQSAKNSNNKFLELAYKAKEMQHYKAIGINDTIMYFFNRVNKHGLNWVRPTFALISCTLIIWIPFATNLFYRDFGSFDLSNTFHTLRKLFSSYFFSYWQLLNPISRISDISKNTQNISGTVSFLFLLSKTLNAIFIYQIITAFRKWGGKE